MSRPRWNGRAQLNGLFGRPVLSRDATANMSVDQSATRVIQGLVANAYPAAGDAIGKSMERYQRQVVNQWPVASGESRAGFTLVYRVQGDIYDVDLTNTVRYAKAITVDGASAAGTIVFGQPMLRLEAELVRAVPIAIARAVNG